MEQNRLITIVIVSVLVGGLIGGGFSYYLTTRTLNNSLSDLENSIDESLEAVQTNISWQIDSIETEINQIDSTTKNLMEEIEIKKMRLKKSIMNPPIN